MKRIISVLTMIFFILTAKAQEPVKWTFTSKKIAEKTYEVHMTATVSQPWSIYSQTTPDGGPLPTAFTFNKNPLVATDGSIKEVGTMKKKHEEVFGVDVHYYKDKVDFVQTIKVKAAAKTNLTGSVEFMACNEEQCLPPKSIPFNIALN